FFQIGQRRIKNVVSLLYLGFIFALGQILVVRFIIVVDAFCQNRSTQVNVGLQVIGVNGQCFLVRSDGLVVLIKGCLGNAQVILQGFIVGRADRKSTRLNSSHVKSSYAVFCLKKQKRNRHVH